MQIAAQVRRFGRGSALGRALTGIGPGVAILAVGHSRGELGCLRDLRGQLEIGRAHV